LEETVVLNGIPLVVWDTAGLRHTTDEVEKIGVERAKAGIQAADLVLAIFDASRHLDQEDETVFASVHGKTVIPILNKTDLPTVIEADVMRQRLQSRSPVWLSATQGTGIEELGKRIESLFLGSEGEAVNLQESSAIVSNVRHRAALVKTEESLGQALEGLVRNLPLDLLAVDLHTALEHIGEITGHVTSEDILDRIFKDFCIGK
jgi:tRNA modification GTPase